MNSYHITKKGQPGLCVAQVGACPLGGESGQDNHFNSAEEARTAYEEKMSTSILVSHTGPGSTLSTSEEVVTHIFSKYPDVKLQFSKSHGGYHVIDGLKVPKGKQKQGTGTAIMEELIEIADKNNWPLALTVSTDWGATSNTRLKKFYKRFGFLENKSPHKDFTTREGMLRPPTLKY